MVDSLVGDFYPKIVLVRKQRDIVPKPDRKEVWILVLLEWLAFRGVFLFEWLASYKCLFTFAYENDKRLKIEGKYYCRCFCSIVLIKISGRKIQCSLRGNTRFLLCVTEKNQGI